MIQFACYGRLGADARQIATKTGMPIAAGSIAVYPGDAPEREDCPPMWFGLVAFGRQAEELLRHGGGGLGSVAGRAQRRR